MRLNIHHETIYHYAAPASYSIQYLRLTPPSVPGQRVLSWKLSAPATLKPWMDTFGNQAHVLVIDQPHEEIRLLATGEVESDEGEFLISREGEIHPPALFLRPTRLTEASANLSEFASALRPALSKGRRKGLGDLMHAIRDAVSYQPGITDAATSAFEAFDHKAGVCQDHAHIFIACCKILGIPARYVSGYLCTAKLGEEGMASHAWAEAWIDEDGAKGWATFDVANRTQAGEAHVRLAHGLDYLDACPVRGIRKGGRGEALDVSVHVGESSHEPKRPTARESARKRASEQSQQ
ncbi:MAG: transglutaminase family protein [Alphaproteobacteria bacterium]|nr:transglutaminase family protein [Alphaproteobacteria bacterium]